MALKKNGGFIVCGQPYTKGGEENCEYTDVQVWGRVIWDAKTYKYKKKNLKTNQKIDFVISYGTKLYISVWTYGETPVAQVAQKLKADDEVVVFGRMIKKWRFKDGEQITSVYIDPFIIVSARLLAVANTLAYSDKFAELIADKVEENEEYDEDEEAKKEYERYVAKQKEREEYNGFA